MRTFYPWWPAGCLTFALANGRRARTRRTSAPGVDAGESVRVDGQVVRFSVTGVEEDLDIDIVDNEFEDFDGDPVVQATSIAPA